MSLIIPIVALHSYMFAVEGCNQKQAPSAFLNRPMNIASLNMWGLTPFKGQSDLRLGFLPPYKKERIKGVWEYFNADSYDIVFLQEVWFGQDHHSLSNSNLSYTPYGLGTMCHGKDTDNEVVFPNKCHGLVTLSKAELTENEFVEFQESGEMFENQAASVYIKKGFLVSKIYLQNDIEIQLINTNLALFEPAADVNHRIRILQVLQIIQYLKKDEKPDVVILAGSLNAGDDTNSTELISILKNYGFEDTFVTASINNTICENENSCYTWGNKNNTFSVKGSKKYRVDNILILNRTNGTNIDVTKFEVPNLTTSLPDETKVSLSDHDPVHVELMLSVNQTMVTEAEEE